MTEKQHPEYGRTTNEGLVPTCAPSPPKSVCQRNAAAIEPAPNR